MPQWRKTIPALAAVAALGLSFLPSRAGADDAIAEPPPFGGTPNHATMLGDFAAPVWLDESTSPDGVKHIDAEATLDALEEANANTYAYIISGLPHYAYTETRRDVITAAQWADVPAFAEAAAERDIDVYLYIGPPSNGYLDNSVPRPEQEPGLRPFGWDYVKWAEAVAKLAVTHPNIGGMFIDDFNSNTEFENSPYSFAFTPDYVREMSAAARVHDPDFKIYGIIYYQALQTSSAFRDALDGVVFPYRANTGDPGTADPSKAVSEGEIYADISSCVSDEMCLGFEAFAPAAQDDAATLSREVAVTGEDNQLRMQVNNDDYLATCPDGACFEFSAEGYQPTEDGDYVAISQTVSVTEDGPHELSLWVDDDNRGVTSGYHMLEVLIDGELVIERDLAGQEEAGVLSADVSEELEGKDSVELTVRLHNPNGVTNFGGIFWVDDVAITGAEVTDGSFDDRNSDAWTWSTVGGLHQATYTGGEYDLEVLVDGTVAANFPVNGYDGWHEVEADLSEAFEGKTSAEVGLRLRTVGDDVVRSRHVWVDDFTISGTSAETADDTGWTASDGDQVTASTTRSHEAIWMVYASRLAADVPGHQPSPEYIRSVQTDGLNFMREGAFDGSLIYVLNLNAPLDSAEGKERAIIGELYGDYAATDLADCDEVLTGSQLSISASEGRTCLVDADVRGTVSVDDGAELLVVDSSLSGSLRASGNLALCDSTLRGSLTANGGDEIRIGATPSLCAGNEFRGGTVVTGTTDTFTVAGNSINGALSCNANTEPSNRGVPNTVSGSATNECANV